MPPPGGGEIAGVHRRGIAAFGGGESRRLAAEKTPCPRRGDCRGLPAETPYPRRRAKGDRTPSMVSCPLLTPLTFLRAATPYGRAAKRGLRGLGSVRRADFGTLLCPEFTLRSLPRITVRGRTVQGVRLVLRKAPLRSSVDPWSTRRHCGPLAFRRATEGSRVLRKMRGSQEGQGNHLVSLPLLLPSVSTDISAGRRRPSRPPKAAKCARSLRA